MPDFNNSTKMKIMKSNGPLSSYIYAQAPPNQQFPLEKCSDKVRG